MLNKRFKTALVAAAVSLASTQSFANTFEIEHLPNVKHAGNVTVSVDGTLTAYTLSVPRDLIAGDDDGRADTHLYLLRENQSPVKFIGGQGSISGLQFSADGKELFFKTKRKGDDNTALYSISDLISGRRPSMHEKHSGCSRQPKPLLYIRLVGYRTGSSPRTHRIRPPDFWGRTRHL